MITRAIFRVLWAATVFVFAFVVALGVLFLLGALWVGDELRALAPDDPVLAGGSGWMGAAIFAVTVVPALTIVPALVAVVIGEALHIRSWMYYVLAGGAALLAVPLLAGAPGTCRPDGCAPSSPVHDDLRRRGLRRRLRLLAVGWAERLKPGGTGPPLCRAGP